MIYSQNEIMEWNDNNQYRHHDSFSLTSVEDVASYFTGLMTMPYYIDRNGIHYEAKSYKIKNMTEFKNQLRELVKRYDLYLLNLTVLPPVEGGMADAGVLVNMALKSKD